MSVLWFAVGILVLVPLLIVQQRRITELRRSRHELPGSGDCQLFAQELIEAVPCPVFFKAHDGRYLGCNGAFAEYLGRPREQIIGQTVCDISPKELADGSLRDVVMHKATFAGANGAVGGMIGVVTDISERKRAEEALRASEQQFHTLANNLPYNIARYDRHGRWVYLNRGFEESLGIEARNALGKTLRETFPDEVDAGYLDCLATVLKTGQPADIDVAWPDAGRGLRYHNVRFVAERGREGEISGALAMGHDVTERRNTQRQLEIQNAAVNTTNDAVFLIDDTLRFVFVNETACRSLGYSREELLTMGPADIDPDVTPEIAQAMVNSMVGCSEFTKFETRHRAKDGRIYPVEIGGAVFKHEGRTFGLSVVRDITERKRMEEALQFVARRGWRKDDKNVFEPLVRYLGQTLGVDYAMVAKLGEAPGSAESVALYAKGAVVPNVRYEPNGTPCEHVMGRNYCCHPSGVQQSFPENRLLVELGAESYASIPLWDSCGQPLGLIAVLDGKPLQSEAWVAQLLQVVAPRAAAELERARSDAKLRAREREFRSLAESSPDCIIRYDRAGRILYLNSQLVRELGIATAADVIGRLPCEIWPDGRFAEIDRAIAQAMETATDVTIELCVPSPSGEQDFSQTHIVPEWDDAGEVIGAIAFGRDITELKRYQQTLSARELEFRSLAENAPDSIARYDRQGRILYVNPRLAEMLRVAACDAVGKMPQELIPDWDMAAITTVVATGEPVEIEFTAPDTRAVVRQYLIRLVAERGPQGDIVGVLAIGRDVTKRKRAERELLILSSAINNASDGVLLINEQIRFAYVNDRVCRSLGYSRDKLLTMVPADIGIPREVVARMHADLLSCSRLDRMETRYRAADGRVFPVEMSASLVEHESEKMALVVVRDITDRKRMEDALRLREEEFRSLAENLPDIVMRYDLECRYIYVNPAYIREMEAPEDEVLKAAPDARHWRSSSLSLDEYKARLLRVMTTGEPAELALDWTRRRDGVAAHYAMGIVAERDADGRVIGALCIGRNIIKLMESERRLEESRRQLRDLAARREDAREEERRHIARELHDELGQQLSALRFNVAMLAYDFGEAQPEIREAVDNLLNLVGKTIRTTREVSSALRPPVLDMGIVPALEWLVSEYAVHGGVSFELKGKPGDVRMNDACTVVVFRVVQESLTNAVRHSKADRIEVVFGREAEAYVVEVRDNGIGFDPDAPRDRRSVGLVGIRERALAVGGELVVSSAPGWGTVLRVVIPAVADQKEKS